MQNTVRVYSWLKVVRAGDEGEIQLLYNRGGQAVMRHRLLLDLPPRVLATRASGGEIAGAEAAGASGGEIFMGIALATVPETWRHGAQPMAFILHAMPGGTTSEQAQAWIATPEGIEWTRGADAWILMYGAGIVSTQ